MIKVAILLLKIGIEKMSEEGVFGGKVKNSDIISKMYKIKISVLIKFNDEYSSILWVKVR